MKYSDIKLGVKQLGDGRDFTTTEYDGWMKRVRFRATMSFPVGGFKGLYFLYKEATVIGGATIDDPNRYAMPSDFIDDLSVFYEGTLLVRADAQQRDIAAQTESLVTHVPTDISADTTVPTWVLVRGSEFEIQPVPAEAGGEIKLLYNGLPDVIENDDAEDYFMARFPDLHIFGMGELMCYRLGAAAVPLAKVYGDKFTEQLQELQIHNRMHYLKTTRIRFQNWDEYQSVRNVVFPQFAYTVGGEST